MKTIAQLKALAEAKIARTTELLDLAGKENRDLTDAEKAEFEQCEKDCDNALAEIERMKRVEDRSAKVAAIIIPTAQDVKDVTGTIAKVAQPATRGPIVEVQQKKLTGAEVVGVCAWACAKNKLYPRKSAYEHLADAGFQSIVDLSHEEQAKTMQNLMQIKAQFPTLDVSKAFMSITAGGGDNTIFTPLLNDFIEFLYNESAFMSGGPVQIDMSYGSVKLPGGNAGASASYGAEGADIGYTQPTTRNVQLSAKHLRALTAINNFNLDISPLAVAQLVGDDLSMAMQIGMDAAGLRGDGSGDNPAGILSLVNAAHKFAATATSTTPTYAQIDADAKAMLTKIRSTNIPKRRRRWIMCNRIFTYLQFMRDGNGNYVYPGLQLANPTWYDGIPVTVSEQAPSNLGVGTNESEIYLIDFGHVLMGVTRVLRLTSSTEASYVQSGNTISAFSRDETVIRAMASHDFDMRHTKAAVVLTAVKWGG